MGGTVGCTAYACQEEIVHRLFERKVVQMAQQLDPVRRIPLSRDRVLRAAVTLADVAGIESLSMRNLAQELGVVPMALYKHVANKAWSMPSWARSIGRPPAPAGRARSGRGSSLRVERSNVTPGRLK